MAGTLARSPARIVRVKATTKSCSRHAHREVEVEVGELASVFWESLIEYLEESVANGTKLLPGQTVLFGFQLLEVRESGDKLTLYAPIEATMPMEYGPDVGAACLATIRQR